MEKVTHDFNNIINEFNKSLSKAGKISPSSEKEFKAVLDKLMDFSEKLKEIEKLVVLGSVIRLACHELRNPIAAINTSAYYLKSYTDKDKPDLISHTDLIRREIESTTRILDTLSLFYKSPEPSLVLTSVNALLEQVISNMERKISHKKINTIKNLDPSLPKIMIDMDQLGRAIENILQNAFDSVAKRGEIKVSAIKDKNRVQVSIADNGCGIPEENMDKIFDPGFSTKSKGIGLGLALARGIIERHNGSIDIKSKLKRGTAVTVSLPVNP